MKNENMGASSDRLQHARERAGYTSAKSAAEAMGVPPATYIQHENGTRGFPASTALRYGRFFRVTPEWLLYGATEGGPFLALGPQLYVKGEVAAGVWSEAKERDPDEWEVFTGLPTLSASPRDRFGLRVVGPSMNQVYPPGSIIECITYKHDVVIRNGQRIVVQRKRADETYETTVKEYLKDADGVEWFVPRSDNPAYQTPIRADQAEPGVVDVSVIGIVVASIRPE